MNEHLINISRIDKEIEDTKNDKNKYIYSKQHRIEIVDFLSYFVKSKFHILLIILLSIAMQNITSSFIKTFIFTSIIVLIFNLIIVLLIKFNKMDERYYNKIELYNESINKSLNERYKEVILYKYSIDKNKFLLNNIKLRINNNYYLDFDNYLENNMLSSKEIILFKKMKEEEEILINNIKNEINYQINYEVKNEELYNKLKNIQLSLSY